MSNTVQRVATAIVAAPLVLYLAYVGGWPFAGLVAAIGLLGQHELYGMAERAGASPLSVGGLGLGALGVAAVVHPALWVVVGGGLLLFVAVAPLVLRQEQFVFSFSVTIAGVVYPTGLLGSLVWLRQARGPRVGSEEAFYLVLLTVLLVWATDIAAYAVGKAWGRRALAPSISPNKTWEGTIGGFAAAATVGVTMKLLFLPMLTGPHLAAVIVLGGGVSQLGDLFESELKRSTDTDDSSALLPGHGGILDRFDAMAVAAPAICLYLDAVAGVV